MIYTCSFDSLHSADSRILTHELIGDTLVLEFEGMVITSKDLTQEAAVDGYLLFTGLQKSRRVLHYYKDERRQGFARREEIIDAGEGLACAEEEKLSFEGTDLRLNAWVDWSVWAEDFKVLTR